MICWEWAICQLSQHNVIVIFENFNDPYADFLSTVSWSSSNTRASWSYYKTRWRLSGTSAWNIIHSYMICWSHWRRSVWGRHIEAWTKMGTILLTTFSNTFCWMKIIAIFSKYIWNLFLRAHLTGSQHWFRWWLGTKQLAIIYLNQCSCPSLVMTSSNRIIFHITGHLCGEFNSHRWISCTKASDVELWCFLWSGPE